LEATGIGTVNQGMSLNTSSNFKFSSGQVTAWVFQARNSPTTTPVIATIGPQVGAYDDAVLGAPTNTACGWYQIGIASQWIGPKSLGTPSNYLPHTPDPTPSPVAQTPTDDPNSPNCNKCVNTASGNNISSRGDPIDIATGNVFEEITDYTTIGANRLAFIRYYNSMANGSTPATALGRNWRSNYDRYLRDISSTEVDAERPDGKIITFILVSGVWTPSTDVDMTLTTSGSTYTLTDHNDAVETYTVSGSTGTLNSIAYPNGYTQTLSYTSGVLTSVSDSYSRSISFTYTSGLLTGVSTPDSATLTYGYTTISGKSVLTSVTYNTSPSTSRTYVYGNSSYPFALTGITDENGNSFESWTYDNNGRATDTQLAGGADEIQVAYTGNAYRVVTNALGEQETYQYSWKQGVPKVTSIARAANSPVVAATRSFTYDTNGYIATATDFNGNSTHYTNNSHGEPTSITEAYGTGRARTTTITYDSTWVHKPYTITRTNQTIDYRYDSSTGNLLTKTITDTTGGPTNGQTHVWTYTYNSTGQMLTEQFPRTGTTVKNTYTYSGGALASVTDQLSHTMTINTANGTGQPTQITDPNSVVTDLVYNNRNWLTSKTVNATTDEVTTFTYTPSGQVDVVTLPDSSTLDYDYDNAHRVTKVTNTAGETMNYTLDDLGDITAFSIKDSGGATKKSWTATYDVLGDRLTLVGAGGSSQTTSYTYDKNQNRKSTTDANSKQWQQTWDELNRATTVTDPLTHTAAPTYNNLDYVTAQTDFLTFSTSYTRDAFGNAIARSSPDTGSWSFTFDGDNNLTAITDARSVATANTYDAVDRLTGVSITGYSGENETFSYDDTTSGNKGVGRLTSVSDESGSTSRVYDNFGNITSETRVIGGKTYTTSYSYDLANRITEIIYPSSRYVDYTYDSSGYLTTVTTKPSAGGTVTTLASSITHKPFGPIVSFTYGNSEAQTRTYDNNYWLTGLSTVYSGTYVQNLSYGYDNAGNLTSITDSLNSGRSETYTVDGLNRLATASGAYGSRTYTYDNNSGRATKVAGTTTYTTTRVTSKNRVDHISDGTNTRHFTWTSNGDLATDDRVFVGGGAISNTFGGRDRLESMTVNSQMVTFKVNAFGQRVSKAFSGTTTHFINDSGGHIIAEADGSTGTTTKEYVWMEGMLLAQIDGSGNIAYVHSDQVENPQKITDPSRTLVWDREQEPFGETYATPTNTTPTNHRFPGQYADAENTLSYNNMRDYDPSTGFYIEADPLGLAGGLNPYSYAIQNPTGAIDPSGMDVIVTDNHGSHIFNTSLAFAQYVSNLPPHTIKNVTFVGHAYISPSIQGIGNDKQTMEVIEADEDGNVILEGKGVTKQYRDLGSLLNDKFAADGTIDENGCHAGDDSHGDSIAKATSRVVPGVPVTGSAIETYRVLNTDVVVRLPGTVHTYVNGQKQ
jgi:RHS repeat-associated protein